MDISRVRGAEGLMDGFQLMGEYGQCAAIMTPYRRDLIIEGIQLLVPLMKWSGGGAGGAGGLRKMTPRTGFEPVTNRLTVDRSTAELPRNMDKILACPLPFQQLSLVGRCWNQPAVMVAPMAP